MVAEDIWVLLWGYEGQVQRMKKKTQMTNLGQVNGFESQLPQSFPSVDIGFSGAGDPSTTKFRSDTILGHLVS